jgi:hypothetical protein
MDYSQMRDQQPGDPGYSTQADRSGSYTRSTPRVTVEQSFTFSEQQIKEILADYVSKEFHVSAVAKDVTGDYRSATYANQFDHDPGYCRFIVKVRR